MIAKDYWSEVELSNGVVAEFKERFRTIDQATDHAVEQMSPLGEGWRVFIYRCNTLRTEYIVVKGLLIKVKNINEVY